MNKHDYSIRWIFLLLIIIQSNRLMAIEFESTLTVTQLISAVLEANPRLEIAQATWQAAVAKIEGESALDDPQLRYGMAPLTIDSDRTHFGQRVQLSQKLPFPGKLYLRAKVAEFQAETKQYGIASLQLLLAKSVKLLFFKWYFIHRAIAIDQKKQGLLKEFRDVAISQYSTGRTSRQLVLQAETKLVLLNHQFIVLQRQKKICLAQLNTLLNRSVNKNIPVPRQLANINALPKQEKLYAHALNVRPELKAVEANINAYKAEVDLTGLAYYPDFKVSAGYNSLWNNEDKRFNMGIDINIPLDQSKRRAAEQIANANRQQENWKKIAVQSQISEELAIAYAQAEESLHVKQLYFQQLSSLADESLAVAKTDYQAGKGDYLTLITRKIERLQTQRQAEQALTDVHRRFAELEWVVGLTAPLSIID